MTMINTSRFALAAFSLAVTASVGCGDVALEGAETAGLEVSLLEGMTVRLGRYSTECSQRIFDGALAEVGPQMEFPSEDVAALRPPCDDSLHPGISFDFVGDSLLIDFSSVESPGAFTDTRFDGYEIRLDRDCGDPVVVSGTMDVGATTPGIPAYRVETAVDTIEINLAGLAYDVDSFLKIDLEIMAISCVDD